MKKWLFLFLCFIVAVQMNGFAQSNQPRFEQLRSFGLGNLSVNGNKGQFVTVDDDGKKLKLTSVVLTEMVTGVLPVANGGTGSLTQNFVDLSTTQTVAGAKTWSSLGTFGAGLSLSGSASGYVGFAVPASVTSYTLTFPSSKGSNGQVLQTNASGVLSWVTPSSASGTVTSVGLSLPSIFTVSNSPVTSSGTLTGTLVSQTSNYVFAAPSSGNGTPVFRALVAGDLPSIDLTSKVTGVLPLANGGTGSSTKNFVDLSTTQTVAGAKTWSSLGTFGAGLNLSGSASGYVGFAVPASVTSYTLTFPSSKGSNGQVLQTNASGVLSWVTPSSSSGTVTSVGLSLPSIFTVSNSPVTSSGTLTGTLVSQTSNYVFAAPSSGNGTPVFRALVAGDLPSIDLTSKVTGVLPLANGGTGSSTKNFVDLSTTQTVAGAKTWSDAGRFSAGITVGTSTTTYTLPTARGTADQLLKTDGSGNVAWKQLASYTESFEVAASPATTYALSKTALASDTDYSCRVSVNGMELNNAQYNLSSSQLTIDASLVLAEFDKITITYNYWRQVFTLKDKSK